MSTVTESADFEALDACHQQIASHLKALKALVKHVAETGVDPWAQQQAAEIEAFFSGTSREHHAEEERNVFPPLLATADTALAQTIRTLQQDHGWIEENWIELAPQLRAMADGHGWTDPAEFQHYAEVFLSLCEGHIALEESLIYPESKARWAAVVARRLTELPALVRA